MDEPHDEWEGYRPFGGLSSLCQHLIAFGFELLVGSFLGHVLGVLLGTVIFILIYSRLL